MTKEYIPKVLREVDVTYLAPPKRIMYVIGEQHNLHEISMWHGPNPNEKKMLEIEGKSEKSCIIRFNIDDTDEIIWRWKEDRWISVKE